MSENDRYYNKALKAIILVFTFSKAQMSYGQTLNYHIYFKVGISEIDKEYKSNAQNLACIDSIFKLGVISEIEIKGFSSPEGTSLLNQKLSEQRAGSLKTYILKRYSEIAPEKVYTEGAGVNWGGLRDMVNDSEMKYRERVLYIIDNVPDKIIGNTSRKKQLMDLGGGNAWRYMEKEFFPSLRVGLSTVKIIMQPDTVPEIKKDEEPKIGIPQVPDTIPSKEILKEPQIEPSVLEVSYPTRTFLMAIKSNMLYDAALTPNVAIEFYLGRGWSVEGEFNYAWWKFNSSRFHRIEWGGLEMRKWFLGANSSPLSGWFVGTYGLAGNYDFMYSSVGQKSSRTGTKYRKNSGLHNLTYSVGLTGGYSMPIGKRLNLEFELGLGYLWGEYDRYNYDLKYNDYHYIDSRMRHYFGPTKLEVSVSWLIGNGYNVKTKGGKL